MLPAIIDKTLTPVDHWKKLYSIPDENIPSRTRKAPAIVSPETPPQPSPELLAKKTLTFADVSKTRWADQKHPELTIDKEKIKGYIIKSEKFLNHKTVLYPKRMTQKI
jgi:hypothetical protein